MTFADATARYLSDEGEDARAGRIGGGERRGAVEKTGTGHHGVGGWFAGRECGAERHVGGALFVPGMHHRERVAGVEHGVEQMITLDAGQGVDRGNAVREDRAHDSITTTHQRHASLRLWLAAVIAGLDPAIHHFGEILAKNRWTPGSKPGGDAVAAVASASYRNRVYPTLIRQVERRQRLLPLRGFGGEEAREGLVVIVGRRRRQRAGGG